MKMTNLCLAFACLTAVAASAAPKTWTFCEAGSINFQSGSMTFAKDGRIDADFLRLDGTNVFLKVRGAGNGYLPLASLSEADRAYVAKVKDVPVDVTRPEQQANERQIKNPKTYEPASPSLAPSSHTTVTPPPSSSGGTVHVRGYTRKDGTYVRPHTRSAPKR